MLVRGILAILGASTLAAATSTPPAVTPFLTTPVAAPTTLVPVPLPITSTSLTAATTSPSHNSTLSTPVKTVTSLVGATRTVTLRPSKTNSYEACGGLRASPKPCPASFVCIRDPFVAGCGPACDQMGICVVPIVCDGIRGIKCPAGKTCVDDPRDSCDPLKNGADCAGLCI